jgi:hypothetical protein
MRSLPIDALSVNDGLQMQMHRKLVLQEIEEVSSADNSETGE